MSVGIDNVYFSLDFVWSNREYFLYFFYESINDLSEFDSKRN